eukprot:CAMPEP_0117492628 /NCGR_PEP_ID=MMETSP0784-20121206/18680_1 /TAXON_ID=39447 /ORGANISM="" /LENGTH=108 /DNA_ID=CAMNT_0005287455 /DNA_START=130 /DNA_END=452 /DNA_ORIENTATION=-
MHLSAGHHGDGSLPGRLNEMEFGFKPVRSIGAHICLVALPSGMMATVALLPLAEDTADNFHYDLLGLQVNDGILRNAHLKMWTLSQRLRQQLSRQGLAGAKQVVMKVV